MTARLRYDDVEAGAALPAQRFPIRRVDLVRYCGASGDFNVIHWNERSARDVGLPDVIAHGMWTMGAAGSVVEEWAGDGGRVVEFGTRFTKPVVVPAGGGEVEVSGVVKALDEQTRRATVELSATSGGAKVLGRCLAVVQLD